jgi:hypothetical protein
MERLQAETAKVPLDKLTKSAHHPMFIKKDENCRNSNNYAKNTPKTELAHFMTSCDCFDLHI